MARSIKTTSTGIISASPILIDSFTLNPAAATASARIFDNASAASGTEIATLQAAADGSSVVLPFTRRPYYAENGLYVTLAGVGASLTTTIP